MAGDSGTPLPKKLGIQKQFRVCLIGMPWGQRRVEGRFGQLSSCEGWPRALDFAMIFVKTAVDLRKKPFLAVHAACPGGHALGELAEKGFRSVDGSQGR
jgi:hypothetical protein